MVGYYTCDTGDGDVSDYYMGDEPPEKQYVLRGKTWELLPDPWSLMDRIIDGDPDYDGPTVNPPRGVPSLPKRQDRDT
jgi:hypothetical protein